MMVQMQASQTMIPTTLRWNFRDSPTTSLTDFLLGCLACDAASIAGHRMPFSMSSFDVAL